MGSMREGSQVVSFRLPEHYSALLKKRAESEAQSPGDYARRLVIRALEDTDRKRIFEDLAQIKQGTNQLLKRAESTDAASVDTLGHLIEFRRQFRTAMVAILFGAGDVELEDAQNWVRDHLEAKLK